MESSGGDGIRIRGCRAYHYGYINNLSADEEKEIEIAFAGDEHVYSVKEAKVVSAEMHAHNTFDVPELVKEEEFTAYKKCGNGIKVMLPPCSVVELRLQ